MRKRLTVFNSAAGLLNKIISSVFVFCVRHFFVKCLDTQILGLEGLFANLLGIFSLADLGLGNAIAFSLYKPIHDGDRKLLNAIMNLYRKLYLSLGVVIFLLSAATAPFLWIMTKDVTLPADEVRRYFLVYAFSVAITYFFAYKRTLIFALQRNYLVLNVDSVVKVLMSAAQIFILEAYSDYILYLLLAIVFNLSGNLFISALLKRMNPYDGKSNDRLPREYRNRLTADVKALAVTSISWTGISSTDNLIISAVIGIADLAKNANYSLLSNSINSIITSVLGGVSASIGDLTAEGNKDQARLYFDRYCFIYNLVAGYVSLGFYFTSKMVITAWVGDGFVLGKDTVFLISLNLYLTLMFKPLGEYQNYTGVFTVFKPYSVVAFVLNLAVSAALGRSFGLAGVFIGTTVTYVFMITAVAVILHKRVFDVPSVFYFISQAKYLGILAVCAGFGGMAQHFAIGNLYARLAVTVLWLTASFAAVNAVLLRKNENYRFFCSFALGFFKRLGRR